MKKAAIISIISAVLLAAIIFTALWIFHHPNGAERIPKEGYSADPPSVVLTCGETKLKLSWWCSDWETHYTDGTLSAINADYPHPLSEYAGHKTLPLAEPTVQFDFTAPPESVSVSRWPESQIGKSEDAAEPESIPHEMKEDIGTLTAEKGYLYCITGHWKGGVVYYYFIVE